LLDGGSYAALSLGRVVTRLGISGSEAFELSPKAASSSLIKALVQENGRL